MNRRQFLHTAALVAMASPSAWAQSAVSPTRIDRDGMLRVRGRREFILGLYHTPKSDTALRDASAAGFNLIHRPATRAAYDEARALGLMGWSALGSIPAATRADAEQRIRQTILSLRDHPALLFWETEDEPTFVWKEPGRVRISSEQLNTTATFIRRLDPNHPIYLNHAPTNLISTLQQYNPGADIVATDIYPVIPPGIREQYALWPDGRQGDLLDSTVGQVGRYAAKMRAVAGPNRAVFMVLQGFAWENLREKDRQPAMVLYPTLAQLRFMAWQAVVHRVNGLIWWGLAHTPADAPFWKDLQRMVGELTHVREALAAPILKLPLQLAYHDTGHSLDRGIEWLAKRQKRGALLIAVNADSNPVDVTFSGLTRFSRCEPVLRGKASDALRKGSWRERFEPFETRVWSLA